MFLVLHDQPAFIEDRNPFHKRHVKDQGPEMNAPPAFHPFWDLVHIEPL